MQTRTYTGVNIETNTLKSALEYTYENASNHVSAVRTVSELGTNTLGVTYGDLSHAQSADIVYAESWNGDPAKSYTYDDLGRLSTNVTHISNNVQLTASYTYKALDTFRSSMLVSEYSSGEGYAYFYEYDDLGNITSETRGNKTTSYEYNEQGMLIRENNKQADRTWVYTYPVDGNGKATSGNILSRKTYNHCLDTPTTSLGAPDATDTFTYGSSAWGDLLTGCGNKTITYSGTRPVYYGDYFLSYYRGGLLSGFSKSGDVNTYTYDVSGRRLTKAHNGTTTTFIYAGDLLLGQKTGTETITFQFDSAGNYFGFTYDGDDYYYVKDLQGDVVAIADTDGFVIVRYYYDAWGRLLSTKDYSEINLAQINPIRYRGYYYDTETGFYFLQSRYYDPEICRFLTTDDPDVISATPMDLTDKHLFAYCDNNPVARIDDDGEFWHLVVGGIIGGTIGCISSIITQKKSGDGKIDFVKCLISTGTGILGGVLTASGVGIVGQVVGGALFAGINNAGNQLRDIQLGEKTKFDTTSLVEDTLVGGVLGFVSGNGASSVAAGAGGQKQMINLGVNSVKRTFHALTHGGVKSYVRIAAKAARYYIRSTNIITTNLTTGRTAAAFIMAGVYSIWSGIK